MKLTSFILLALTLQVSDFILAETSMDLPENSIYSVDSNWINQNNLQINLAKLKGKIQVIAFVYTYCEYSCPVILANLKQISKTIPEKLIDEVQFSLISLDPSRDTPEVLKQYMQEHGLKQTRWQMLNGDADDVLELSVLLGVRYKPMANEGKDISHSNMITVLDKQGRILYQLKGLNKNLEQVTNAINRGIEAAK